MYHQTIEFEDLDIAIGFTFDGERLVCEEWSAFSINSDEEIQIADVQHSEEIEMAIDEWLEHELDINYACYAADRAGAAIDALYDSWREND